jgi:hypothetical protein
MCKFPDDKTHLGEIINSSSYSTPKLHIDLTDKPVTKFLLQGQLNLSISRLSPPEFDVRELPVGWPPLQQASAAELQCVACPGLLMAP